MLVELYALARKPAFLLAAILLLICSAPLRADEALDLSEYRGKVVLVDFWASWCVPCRRSFPWMNEMQEKYAGSGLVIIAVNMDAEAGEAQAFLDDYPANFRIINDPVGDIAKSYDVIAMPSSYVIGRDGSLVKTHLGFKVKKQDEYESALLEALATGTE